MSDFQWSEALYGSVTGAIKKEIAKVEFSWNAVDRITSAAFEYIQRLINDDAEAGVSIYCDEPFSVRIWIPDENGEEVIEGKPVALSHLFLDRAEGDEMSKAEAKEFALSYFNEICRVIDASDLPS